MTSQIKRESMSLAGIGLWWVALRVRREKGVRGGSHTSLGEANCHQPTRAVRADAPPALGGSAFSGVRPLFQTQSWPPVASNHHRKCHRLAHFFTPKTPKIAGNNTKISILMVRSMLNDVVIGKYRVLGFQYSASSSASIDYSNDRDSLSECFEERNCLYCHDCQHCVVQTL